MKITLSPEMERLVAEKVDAGLYDSPSQMVQHGLDLLLDFDELRQRRLDRLRAEIQIGIDQLDRGEGIDGEESYRRLTEELEERAARRR